MQLNKYQAAVLEALFDKLPIGEEIESLEFSLAGEFRDKFRAAFAKLKSTDDYVVFNIPTYCRCVFIGLAHTNPKMVALYLANLEDYARESAVDPRLGEVIVTPAGMLPEGSAPFAVILLRPATSLDCAELPDELLIKGHLTSFLLAVPLTKEEHELRQLRGHDALLDAFESGQKDILF